MKSVKKVVYPHSSELLVSRRAVSLGSAGTALLAASGCGASDTPCILTPEQEEGPFYVDQEKLRQDISEGLAGVPLKVRFTLIDSYKCSAIADAAIDVWSCDTGGTYSGVKGNTETFLRGIQLTDSTGIAEFVTIFPGWYPGRTNHLHIKVHIGGSSSGATYNGGHVSHTGNIFFPEDICLLVAALDPYTKNSVKRTTLTSDFVYKDQDGSSVVSTVTLLGSTPAEGYQANITIGVDPDATPELIGIHS